MGGVGGACPVDISDWELESADFLRQTECNFSYSEGLSVCPPKGGAVLLHVRTCGLFRCHSVWPLLVFVHTGGGVRMSYTDEEAWPLCLSASLVKGGVAMACLPRHTCLSDTEKTWPLCLLALYISHSREGVASVFDVSVPFQ